MAETPPWGVRPRLMSPITRLQGVWPETLVHRACGQPVENVWNLLLVGCPACQALLHIANTEWRRDIVA